MKKYIQMALITGSLLVGGCATTQLPDTSRVFLQDEVDFHKSPAFQRILKTPVDSKRYEEYRIDYLLERIKTSPCNFRRNDKEYSNVRAVMHLRWKYKRKKGQVKSAEDFIKFIATRSSMSGKKYVVRTPESIDCRLHVLLSNELKRLDEILAYEDEIRRKWAEAKEIKDQEGVADPLEGSEEPVKEADTKEDTENIVQEAVSEEQEKVVEEQIT